jgi:hypothetical protein
LSASERHPWQVTNISSRTGLKIADLNTTFADDSQSGAISACTITDNFLRRQFATVGSNRHLRSFFDPS